MATSQYVQYPKAASSGGGSGTVTTVSVVSANGLAGTVANPTTSPAITLSTTITGILKGNGTAISTATVGSDYSVGTASLATGILKSTTTTGALSIAVAGDFPTLNQNTTGTAATFTGSLTGDVTSTAMATTVLKINGVALSGLATGILKNTTTTGVPSIAIASDFPTLNQNTTGTAASFTGSLVGDATGTQGATVVGKINGTSLAGLATGILKNTTTTGVPSIAIAADFPTLNQNTTGTAANITGTTNSTLTTISTLVSVGTITTGVWNGTIIGVARGGTAVNNFPTAPVGTAFAAWDTNKNLQANNHISGFLSTPTAAGTTTLTVASAAVQYFTGVTTQTVKLPTTTIIAGAQYVINNRSTGVVTVQSSAANTIQAMAAGQTAIFTALVATPTTAANWDVLIYANSLNYKIATVVAAAWTTNATYLTAGLTLTTPNISNSLWKLSGFGAFYSNTSGAGAAAYIESSILWASVDAVGGAQPVSFPTVVAGLMPTNGQYTQYWTGGGSGAPSDGRTHYLNDIVVGPNVSIFLVPFASFGSNVTAGIFDGQITQIRVQ